MKLMFHKVGLRPGMMVHTCNPSSWGMRLEDGKCMMRHVTQFQASLACMVRLFGDVHEKLGAVVHICNPGWGHGNVLADLWAAATWSSQSIEL